MSATIAALMHKITERPTGVPDETGVAPDFCGFSFISIDGDRAPLADHLGKVVLIVNVASQCGFRGQYKGLSRLYAKYKDQGLVILGVPCDDFKQEPGSGSDIKQFAQDNYQVEFPLMRKSSVRGMAAHPFYEWARVQDAAKGLSARVRWNFHKYLIGRDGKLAGSYSTLTKPDSQAMQDAIESALAAPGPLQGLECL